MMSVVDNYLPVAMLAIVGVAFVFIAYFLSRLLRPSAPSAVKSDIYECGEITIGDTKIHYNVQYYLYAIAFLIFDVEMIFLYAWAVQFRELGFISFVEVFVFIGILVIGLVYLVKKEALEWIQ
ncbi:MAG: F(420)H(2) dehydrogenase subunit A [Candidatus Argoarchaeum ethanivorans]|uniref:F(420)H(2) dehydrogenase subunit A n=1 Tax=Candidatus Argoarchaeum ethanivorans TaxID=2608793 RepID=A0A811TCN8_9EURY|nr:MAG: F(420)H(2) dehydrogenase subunit A [Candidatus Argoarchaeum ethanivorans]